MPILRSLLVVLLSWLLTGAAAAQQVFVRNQPFDGKVIQQAGLLWVELPVLQRTLGFVAQVEGEGVRIEGRLVRAMELGGVRLVPLAQAAAAVGAVVREDPSVGTVDVYRTPRGHWGLGHHVDPSELAASASGGAPDTGEPRQETASFSLSLPPGMSLSRDPRLMRAFLEGARRSVPSDARLEGLVFTTGDLKFSQGAAVLLWWPREAARSPENEESLWAYQVARLQEWLRSTDLELVRRPERWESQGQRYLLAAGVGRRPPHHGCLVLSRVDAKRGRHYQVLVANLPTDSEKPTYDFMNVLSSIKIR